MLSDRAMPDQLVIRSAGEGDIRTILQLIAELAEYERAPAAAVATPELLHDALFGAGHVAYALVAEWDGSIVGFALYFLNFSTWTGRPGLYLEDIYVQPAMRGRGIGLRLFQHLAQEAMRRNCTRLELSVLDWNESAIGFYESLGGVAMDGWTVYRFTPDAIGRIADAGVISNVTGEA